VSFRPGGWAVAALVGVGAFVALWLFTEPPPDPIRAGQPAPPFALPRLEPPGQLSLADLRGRVVLLNFWATWCGPCEEEMPAMQRLYERFAGPDFELVAVSVDTEGDVVKAFRERLGLTFPILHDPDRKVSHAYQSHRYPESYLIDRDGRIVARYIGPRDWDAAVYQQRIAELVAGEGGAPAAQAP
jgi:peroxiredoxin